jgi:ADP-ribosylglycohydrolase
VTIEPTYPDRVQGCLLGGALGNAVGYAQQQSTAQESPLVLLQQSSGPAGGLPFAEETQLTLYTVDGLVDALEWANDGVAADEVACLWLAYLRWLATQGEVPAPIAPSPPPRRIDGHAVLRRRSNPGSTSITGLRTGEMGTRHRPVNPTAQDAGALSRSAPFGLVPRIPLGMVDKLTRDAAALTHGHPAARTAAVVFATLIHRIVVEASTLPDAVARAAEQAAETGDGDLSAALTSALAKAAGGAPAPSDPAAGSEPSGSGPSGSGLSGSGPGGFGPAGTATEALASAVYAVLAADGGAGRERDGGRRTAAGNVTTGISGVPDESPVPVDAAARTLAALQLAVDHGGSPATTGSLVGNLMGALHGLEAFPSRWLDRVEGSEVVEETASALIAAIAGEKAGS